MHSIRKLSSAVLLSVAIAGSLSAQTVTAVQGSGMIVRPSQGGAPLSVLVRNAQGQPAVGTVVNWTLFGQGSLSTSQSVTDANGIAINAFTGGIVFGANFVQTTVTASALGVGTNLIITI